MIYTRDQIDQKLRSNGNAVEKAIVKLFELQTQNEQVIAGTILHNDKGFSCTDAKAGTRFARWLLGMNDRNEVCFEPKSLSHPLAARIFSRYCKTGEKPIARALRIVLKHSRQLTDLANGDLTILSAASAA